MTFSAIFTNRCSFAFAVTTVIIISQFSCGHKMPVIIKPLHPFEQKGSYEDGGRVHKLRYAYFTINRKLKDSLEFKPKVDSIIRHIPDSIKAEYYLNFYEESKTLNERYISDNHEHPEKHIKELILVVNINGKNDFSYEYYKDGYFWSTFEDVKLVPVKDK